MKLDLPKYEGHTRGPWDYNKINDMVDAEFSGEDVRLMTDAPKLLAYAKELEAKVKSLSDLVEEMRDVCHICDGPITIGDKYCSACVPDAKKRKDAK